MKDKRKLFSNIKLAIHKASYKCTKCGTLSANATTRPCKNGGNCTFLLHS